MIEQPGGISEEEFHANNVHDARFAPLQLFKTEQVDALFQFNIKNNDKILLII